MRQQQRVACAVVLLAGTVGGGVSSLPRPASQLLRLRGLSPRAAPVCVLDLADCLGAFLQSGNFACVSEATGVGSGALPTREVVNDVVAGLTGGFVGVTGTVVTLELGKQSVREQLKCQYCNGEGSLKCGQCYGEGCAACGGTGRVKCVSCGGSGRAVSSDLEKEQVRAIFGMFPEMRYGPDAALFDERDEPGTGAPTDVGAAAGSAEWDSGLPSEDETRRPAHASSDACDKA